MYAEYGVNFAINHFWDDAMSYDQNIENITNILQTQEGKLLFKNLSENAAR
jgi:hypothetical protein